MLKYCVIVENIASIHIWNTGNFYMKTRLAANKMDVVEITNFVSLRPFLSQEITL